MNLTRTRDRAGEKRLSSVIGDNKLEIKKTDIIVHLGKTKILFILYTYQNIPFTVQFVGNSAFMHVRFGVVGYNGVFVSYFVCVSREEAIWLNWSRVTLFRKYFVPSRIIATLGGGGGGG